MRKRNRRKKTKPEGFFLMKKPQVMKEAPVAIRGGYVSGEALDKFVSVWICGDCPLRDHCNTPCRAYLYWYDQRLLKLRRKLERREKETLGVFLPRTERWAGQNG